MIDPLTEFLDQLDRDADFYAGNNVSVMQLATGEVKALVAVARAAQELDDCTAEFMPNDPGACVEFIQRVHDALARLAAAAKGGET